MIQIVYKPNDYRYIFLKGPAEEMNELEKFFNKIPQYMFMPSFKGVPKPEVYLNKIKTKTNQIIYFCHSGLWRQIYTWAESKGIQVTGIDSKFKYTGMDMDLDEFIDYVYSWNLNLTPRQYQIKAAWLILKYRQSLSELATRSGKTLIAYIVFRYMLEHGAKNILMIVPSVHLIKQGVKDMKEYQEFFNTETIWANSELCESSNLTIGTYQSLVKMADKGSKSYNPDFFNKFDIVCVDEAHHLVCKSINTILSLGFLKNIKIKFGFTGTLPKENSLESFACQSLMGPKIQNITAIELIEGKVLATPIIEQIYIKYNWDDELLDNCIECGEYLNSNYVITDGKKELLPKSEQKFTIKHKKTLPLVLQQVKPLYTKQEYVNYLVDLCSSNGSNLLNLEQMLVHRSKKHLDVILNLLTKIDKNCIVFAHHESYIDFLEKVFKEKFPDKIVYKIKGQVNLNKRQKIIDKMMDNNNVILVASYGCCGTGLTFKNVDYGIFAQSFKSEIINKQSLGRLMLKTEEKDVFYLYDIVDKFPTESLYKQGMAKARLYKNEGYKINKISK